MLNFSQPQGTPSTGIIYSDLAGKLLHVDFEDCTFMGYKVLRRAQRDLFSYHHRQHRAYVQYRQPVPRLRAPAFLAVDVFNELIPAALPGRHRTAPGPT